MPARELADGALILVGGTLLLTPGFVSDIVGLLLRPAVHPAGRPRGADPVPDPQVPVRPGRAGLVSDASTPGHRPGRDNAPDPIEVVQGEVVD